LIRSAAVLVAISRWTGELCGQVIREIGCGSMAPDIRVVPLGTDPVRFRPGLDTDAVRARHRLEPGRWLLTVARLVEHKGIDTAIRAFARLGPKYPELRYAVAGEGDIRSSLEELARSLGVGDRVRFLGAVPESELPNLLNVADVFLAVSRQMYDKVEGFCLALIEASACGVPVVGGTAGGIPDAVRQGETGLLADGEDPIEVAAAVERLLDDEDLRARLGAGGRRAVETYYNWDRVTRDLREIAAAAVCPAPMLP
jgi:phosphatidylinositol alpha-1,6-mannosyltransferase